MDEETLILFKGDYFWWIVPINPETNSPFKTGSFSQFTFTGWAHPPAPSTDITHEITGFVN